MSNIQDTAPPPRPPPPRPLKKSGVAQNHVNLIDKSGNQTSHLSQGYQPLTQSNIVSHDRFWEQDFDSKNTDTKDVLSPPLKHITPEMTEEMWKNYDPLDVVDSTSDHSDTSVDTMIMMTTEEEKRNSERINRSLKEFTALKSKGEVANTNKLKNDIQNKNLHLHIPGRNGMVVPVEQSYSESHDMNSNEASKFTPLHISTGNQFSNFTTGGKIVGTQGLSNADSPDDGYGTNSSTGTISSPCSSSFNSVITELDSSYGSVRKVVLPNGAIKPNSVRESWAVRRKQRMIESEDNSVQEQLRQLTSIQEENLEPRANGNQDNSCHDNEKVINKNVSGYSMKSDKKETFRKMYDFPQDQNQASKETPFINVSQRDFENRNQQLYVIDGDRDKISTDSSYGHTSQPNSRVTIETNRTEPESNIRSRLRSRTSSSGTVGGANLSENSVNVQDSRHEYSSEQPILYGNDQNFDSGRYNPEVPLLRGGSDAKYRTLSGRIYVSESGDEGMYSLNQSSRSTSLSSFQPTNYEQQTPGSPQSPLEKFSGDLLEKWSDMDRNYRNFYGFQDQLGSRSRTDSKVNYFQQKKINNMYDQDNYYRSQSTLSDTQSLRQQSPQGSLSMRVTVPKSNPGERTSKKVEQVKSEQTKSQKTGKDSNSTTKSKLFQILPNMFRPSAKKQNVESKSGTKMKQKDKKSPVEVIPTETIQRPQSVDLEPESEYVNIGDLPQYSLAFIKYQEKRRMGEDVSIESLKTRPVFASSKDITKLFSKQNVSFDSMTSPGSQRHSFHAMPISHRHILPHSGDFDDMRPRAQSTSATVRTRTGRNVVDSRMAVITQKNMSAMNQGQLPHEDSRSSGNISVHSNSSGQQRPGSRPRSRLDSGSSTGESKLSTLV